MEAFGDIEIAGTGNKLLSGMILLQLKLEKLYIKW